MPESLIFYIVGTKSKKHNDKFPFFSRDLKKKEHDFYNIQIDREQLRMTLFFSRLRKHNSKLISLQTRAFAEAVWYLTGRERERERERERDKSGVLSENERSRYAMLFEKNVMQRLRSRLEHRFLSRCFSVASSRECLAKEKDLSFYLSFSSPSR